MRSVILFSIVFIVADVANTLNKAVYSPHVDPIITEIETIESNVLNNEADIAVPEPAADVPKQEELIYIRQDINNVNSIKDWTTLEKRIIERNNGVDTVKYYKKNDQLLKMSVTTKTTRTATKRDYYVKNDSLIFVLIKQLHIRSFELNPLTYVPHDDSLYFHKDQLIKINSNRFHQQSTFTQDYINKKQIDMNEEFKVFMDAF